MGQGRQPLPVVPSPFPDERLSSWIARVADIYRVSPAELQAHVGWTHTTMELEVDPDTADMVRIAYATHLSVNRLLAMTFHDAPARYRSVLRPDARETCLACSAGLERPQRLRTWSFAFSFWCDRHGQALQGSDLRGISLLGDEETARRGAGALRRWALEKDDGSVPVCSALSLLLAPVRRPSPPAAWELARLPPFRQEEPTLRSRPFPRPALGIVVPEFILAVPIYDQQVPLVMANLPKAPRAERYALAIGVGRILKNPFDAAVRILRACDEPCLSELMSRLDSWPVSIRMAVIRGLAVRRKSGAKRRLKRK